MPQSPCSRVTALRGSRLGRICHLAKALAAAKQHVTWRKDTALLVCTPAPWQPAWAFGRPCPLCPGPSGPCPLERHRARPAERPCLCPALALDCAMSFRKAQLPSAALALSFSSCYSFYTKVMKETTKHAMTLTGHVSALR